jgi:MoaA/NifB/PqqE/SkfB family radical SAM enzyme
MTILRIIRTGCDHIILTGGEPLLVPYIGQLINYAKYDLNFKHITILTNASLLAQYENILPVINRLVVSLDATDPDLWSKITQTPLSINETILNNLRYYSQAQRSSGFRLVANCVITPHTLNEAYKVLDFCTNNQISVSFSPQSVNNWPHYDLLVSDKYQQLITYVLSQKFSGAPILASMKYLNSLRTFSPYSCYPMLVPRVWADGSLIYPCRPIEKENTTKGGRPCNLLEVDDWNQAISIANNEFGQPPRVCSSCYQQCYAEPSLMQSNPLSLMRETFLFSTCRNGDLASHAPG